MFAHTLNPSHEGRWTRLAFITAIATAFCLYVPVLVGVADLSRAVNAVQVTPASTRLAVR